MSKMMTSAAANKLLKTYNEKVEHLYQVESMRKSYTRVEGINPILPEYSFSNTRKEIDDLNSKIVELKHAINKFNVITIVGDTGLTIDQVLVKMAQLTKAKVVLDSLRGMQKEQIREGYALRAASTVEYTVANFEPSDAQAEYDRVCEELTELQLNLDAINSTAEFEVTCL